MSAEELAGAAIGRQTIQFDEGPGLHLGTRDTRESA